MGDPILVELWHVLIAVASPVITGFALFMRLQGQRAVLAHEVRTMTAQLEALTQRHAELTATVARVDGRVDVLIRCGGSRPPSSPATPS